MGLLCNQQKDLALIGAIHEPDKVFHVNALDRTILRNVVTEEPQPTLNVRRTFTEVVLHSFNTSAIVAVKCITNANQIKVMIK